MVQEFHRLEGFGQEANCLVDNALRCDHGLRVTGHGGRVDCDREVCPGDVQARRLQRATGSSPRG